MKTKVKKIQSWKAMNLTTPKTRTTGSDAAFRFRLCGDPAQDGAGDGCGVTVVDDDDAAATDITEVDVEVVVDAIVPASTLE